MSLGRFFRPRAVVLVGATEKSPWSQLIHGNFAKFGYAGEVYLVNRHGTPAHGLDAKTSCVDLPGTPDLAYIFVPTDAVPDALADVGAAGIPNALLLSSGYAETGEEGEAAQAALVAKAHECGVRLLGPNSLGFINYAHSIPVTPFPLPIAPLTGSVAIVSQSGATTQVIAAFANQQGIGLSYAIATGNEADVDTAEVIRFLVDDAATKVITVFAETIKDPANFRIAAQACAVVGKPLIVLKVGRTELAQQLAQAHTGSVAGDDRVFDAVCEQDNVIRVHSLEEMITTAGLLAHTGPIDNGAAILSISGGACEVIADVGESLGLTLPQFSAPTLKALREVVSAFGATFNPLDVTGAAVRDPALWERLLAIVARDPGIGAIACVYDMPRGPDDQVNQLALRHIGAGLAATGKPAIVINQALRPVTAEAREMLAELGVPAVFGGLDLAVRALASAQLWSRRRLVVGRSHVTVTPVAVRPTSEREALDFLQEQGVDTPSRVCVLSAGEAVAAWRTMGGPIVLKIASSAIKHKSDIGGVRLDLNDEVSITEAFDDIMASAKAAHPRAKLDGCLAMPMRGKGVELFVGTARTAWGPAIAVGLGGIWIEALDDVALRLLPVDPVDVMAMLDSLRGRKLLDGYRGQAAVNREAIAAQVVRIGNAALALGPDLVSLEVNPLLARGDTAEALDALAVWDEHD